ncbi:MAG: DUF1592 domain-containing protein [Myxococcota bacterium]
MIRLSPLLLCALFACEGTIGEQVPDVLVGADIPEPETIECEGVGEPMLRRLTSVQYRNSLVALFDGDESVPEGEVLSDPARLGFRVDAAEAVIRDLGAQQVMNHAEAVAAWAVEQKLGQLSSCQDPSPECRQAFIGRFGRRAYRRPLDAATVRAYEDLFTAEPTFADGVEAVIATMIQSPHFLYRAELGQRRNGFYHLDDFELATNLAFTLTNRPPSDALLDRAERGELQSPEAIGEVFDELINTDAARQNLGEFAEGWLDVEDLLGRAKDETEVAFGPELRSDMLEETHLLFIDVFESNGGLNELLSADYTFVNGRLRSHYGMGGGGDTFERVELSNGRARGVLGHGSVLSRHALAFLSSPVMRGYFVRERLLCQELPAPPAGIDTNIEPMEARTLTTRERYIEHSENPACIGCHTLMDPIGFAFEHFDAYGRFRDNEHGMPVDATGELTLDRNSSEGVPLDGLDSLSNVLAGTEEMEACFAHYLSYYAYGVEGCGTDFTPATSLRDHLRGVVLADHFRMRALEE